MVVRVDARTLKDWLSAESEIALLDVREAGQFGERHLFFAVPLPYSRFEIELPRIVPRRQTSVVLCDDADGVAERAALRAEALGYTRVSILSDGVSGWERAGYTLFAGVNVPSKTFGELVEHGRHTPRISAQELEAMRRAGDNMVIVDGRPFVEFQRMNIPGGICCPNGELALRISEIAPDPSTTIVVNCAGRTRSIIGAQTLIDFGVPNRVVALENGTQGWFLAGLELEIGSSRRHGEGNRGADLGPLQARARTLATRRGVRFVTTGEVNGWLADRERTTYLLDVRSPEEFAARRTPGFVNAPGGQLVQATDQWVGTKGARIVLLDDEMVRAPVIAQWLRQLGHAADVLEGGLAAAAGLDGSRLPSSDRMRDDLRLITVGELAQRLAQGDLRLIDLRASMTYRKEHIQQAVWSIRPRIAAAVPGIKSVVLVADQPGIAALAAIDLHEAGITDVRLLSGGMATARAAGLPIVATPDVPADADCLDFLFFTAKRHDGDPEAARQYLAWETGLLGQLDEQERGVFRVAAG